MPPHKYTHTNGIKDPKGILCLVCVCVRACACVCATKLNDGNNFWSSQTSALVFHAFTVCEELFKYVL